MTIPENEILEIMQEVTDKFLIPKFKQLNMNASGEWLESLEVEARGNTGVIRGRDYSEYLARGRGPGGRPPIAMIERWVNYKLGISGTEARNAAFAIATKISNEGTSWYPEGSDLLEVLESQEVVGYVRNRLSEIATVQVRTAFERNIKEVFQ